MNRADQKLLASISRLANCNPFSPDRFALEKEILGAEFVPEDSITWNRRYDQELASPKSGKTNSGLIRSVGDRPNVVLLLDLASSLVKRVLESNNDGERVPPQLKQEYWDVVTYLLLYRYITPLPPEALFSDGQKKNKIVASAWESCFDDYRRMLDVDGIFPLDENSAAHLFACLAQIHRAFFQIFNYILGDSIPVARLREKVWESIFSFNLQRYHRVLFDRMRDLSTLVTGPSGTGKELVARAIGFSQYIPFSPGSQKFVADHDAMFFPLNLSALSPTLIESELFGHCRGSFTGAVSDRIGWLEACSPQGAVFLDEIGELELGLQVKLLRVVQQRVYCRLGETKPREFLGKIIAATNRDLSTEIEQGRFREDFYFRLCSDRIETPSLREQLSDRPSDLRWLTLSIARRLSGDDAELLADEASAWIETNLGADYPWNGNIRELEQCVSSYLIRREYIPANSVRSTRRSRTGGDWTTPIADCELTAEELLSRYCTRVYSRCGSYEKTAQLLKIDRRTVKSKIDEELLKSFASEQES